MKKVEEKVEEKVKIETVEAVFDELEFDKDESSSSFDSVYYVKSRTKNDAYFEFTKRVGDKIFMDPRKTIKVLEGNLIKIEQGVYTYENKDIKTLKLFITKEIGGKNNLFILNLNYTQLTRNIINSLIGFENAVSKIYLEIYLNKSGFTSLKMLLNGKKCVWKYTVDDQKKHIEVIKNKKGEILSYDYSDLDDILEQKLREHMFVLFPLQEHVHFTDDDEKTDGDEKSDDAAEFFEIDESN